MARTRKKIVKNEKGESVGFDEHAVPEEVEDDGISEEIEPKIIGKEGADGEETGVVHESSPATVGDSPTDMGVQEADQEVKQEGNGEGSEENYKISPELMEADNIEVSGFEQEAVPVGIVEERTVVEKNTGPTPKDKMRVQELNKNAEFMLSCLSGEIKNDFLAACKDNRCNDIGIYLLGLLNRLWKAVDLYDVDFEPEWEAGVVGQDPVLYCQYCEKRIVRPRNPRQVFCSNLCAKYSKERDKTGIVQPNNAYDGTEEEMDALAWEREQKQMGAF